MAKKVIRWGPWLAEPSAITQVKVTGFKSISDEQSIEIRPLTILSGANSSGKSSIMQPLLLLKQSLEASYNPGPLLLNGPNAKFTSADQLLARTGKRSASDTFQVGAQASTGGGLQTILRKEHRTGFRIEEMDLTDQSATVSLWPKMSPAEIAKTGITEGRKGFSEPEGFAGGHWEIQGSRCFLELAWVGKGPNGATFFRSEPLAGPWEQAIAQIIHVPGLRGNPERVYPASSVGPPYPGTFEKYTASLISQWMTENEGALAELNDELRLLKLTGGVMATRPNDVQIELHVGRMPEVSPIRPEDRVNVTDVGLGISQTLPVLVALHAAKPGTLVYVEQPETHLHPRAEFALAHVLAAAAKRGVKVVVETHSAMLLLGVQALVAEGELPHDKVKLHWFQQEKDGHTRIRPGDLDEAGAFGDWPEDFDDVILKAQKRYLDAADKRLFAR